MKTKKIVIGAMAAAMLSLSVCSLAPAFAADETVQVSVSNTSAEAGGQFKVDVSVSDIPDTGLQGCQFSLEYDSSIISVTTVTAGALTENGSTSADPSSSVLPNFNSYVDNTKGVLSIMWSTSLDEPTYWLKGEGVLFTVTGTVAAGAADGAKSDIKIVPTGRSVTSSSSVMNEEVDCGYVKNGEKVSYNVKLVNGSVTVGSGKTTEPSSENGKYLKGDANCDGKVTIADATAIVQHLGNQDEYGLSKQGLLNADCDGDPGVTGADSNRIQMLEAGLITEV
ncbi:MAG: hypothetical protein K2H19_03120 [Ruminococcus sp.]|nr:hypothetical protein [Ruminococcus sp.]